MSTNSSVKVPATKLLELVRAARQQKVLAHEKAQAEYLKQVEALSKKVTTAIQRFLKGELDPEAIEFDSDGYGSEKRYFVKVPVDFKPVFGPGELSTYREDKDIALLELAGDQAITVRSDSNWAKYL